MALTPARYSSTPIALNPASSPIPPIDASALPIRALGTPAAARMAIPTPQPNQLLSASKIQRIDIWRNEVGRSDVVCVCSLSTAPSSISLTSCVSQMPTSARSPTIHPPAGQALLQRGSPASSVYSNSDVYPTSTQATSPLSSNSLGLMLDGKLDLCPMCGVQRPGTNQSEESSLLGAASKQGAVATPGSNPSSNPTKKNNLWSNVKKIARKVAGGSTSKTTVPGVAATVTAATTVKREAADPNQGRTVSRTPSRLSLLHGAAAAVTPLDVPVANGYANREHGTTSPIGDAGITSPTAPLVPGAEKSTMRKRVSQSFKRISMNVHVASPLQASAPPMDVMSAPAQSRLSQYGARRSEEDDAAGGAGAGGGGVTSATTQMYSALRFATADDEKLLEFMGRDKGGNLKSNNPKGIDLAVAAQATRGITTPAPPGAAVSPSTPLFSGVVSPLKNLGLEMDGAGYVPKDGAGCTPPAKDDEDVDIDALAREDEDDEKADDETRLRIRTRRLREERLEKGRRLLFRMSATAGPISALGVGSCGGGTLPVGASAGGGGGGGGGVGTGGNDNSTTLTAAAAAAAAASSPKFFPSGVGGGGRRGKRPVSLVGVGTGGGGMRF